MAQGALKLNANGSVGQQFNGSAVAYANDDETGCCCGCVYYRLNECPDGTPTDFYITAVAAATQDGLGDGSTYIVNRVCYTRSGCYAAVPDGGTLVDIDDATPACPDCICPADCEECPDGLGLSEAIIAFPGVEWATECVDCDAVPTGTNYATAKPWNDPVTGGSPLFDPSTFVFPATRVFLFAGAACNMGFMYDTQSNYTEQSVSDNPFIDASGLNPIPPPVDGPAPGYIGCNPGDGPATRWWWAYLWVAGGNIHVALFHTSFGIGGPPTDYCLIAFYGNTPIVDTCRKRYVINNSIASFGAVASPTFLAGTCTDDTFCGIGKNGQAIVSLAKCYADEEI